MGVYKTELFSNLGLCCFYSQQYDMTLTCFERALSLATDENMADVWYNIGHIALVNKAKLNYLNEGNKLMVESLIKKKDRREKVKRK